MIKDLKKPKDWRRAICFTWRIDDDKTSKNPRCLILINFIIEGNELFMTYYFRTYIRRTFLMFMG
jgi:thymidylate synthase